MVNKIITAQMEIEYYAERIARSSSAVRVPIAILGAVLEACDTLEFEVTKCEEPLYILVCEK